MSWLAEYWPVVLAVLGAVAAAVGGAAASIKQSHQQVGYERQLRERTDELKAKTQEIADLNLTMAKQNEQFAQTLLNWVTGGDSYAYFEPRKEPQRVAFYIRHGGSYPAYDVTLRVHHQGRLEELKWIGTLSGGSGFDWTTIDSLIFAARPAAGEAPRDIRIEISSRNGIHIQNIRLEATDGRWHSRSRDFYKGTTPKQLPAFSELQDQ